MTSAPEPSWLLLSNHGNVLLCIAHDPTIRISELADRVGIGERAAQRIVAELVASGYLTRTKVGRRNNYAINREGQLRQPVIPDLQIGQLLDVLADGNRPAPPAS